MKKTVGVIGATGYAGAELVRLLLKHPEVALTKVSSVSYEGKRFSDIYPQLTGLCDMELCGEQEVIDCCEIIFAALPNCLSEPIAKQCVEKGKLLIDLGADFRLDSEDSYETWYGQKFQEPELHNLSVYALPELFGDAIKKAKIIGNPGCYPTSVGLGLAPAIKNGLIKMEGIVIDAKSGTTGSGRGLSQTTHYPECNESFAPYKIGQHRHTPEIEQTLSHLAEKPVKITFVPHLLPINRGIVSTIYADLSEEWHGKPLEEFVKIYQNFYQGKHFVRVMDCGKTANLRDVRCSNYCDISIHQDSHTNKLIIVATIDNMVKGAAGQAIQNMNLANGFAEEAGLDYVPPMF